ncbi:MAG TPA: protein kinase [Ktedonosporobacter sp.]|nr:protein kinase [Ktedonosporobacter sp.]
MEGDHHGQQFGNYRLQRLLGRGGFAEVYLGQHLHLGTRAAVKVLHTRLSAEDIANFKNEARTIARLIHPHIVRVLEFGIEGHLPFLVMDYAPGGSLRTLHPKGSRVPLPTIVSYVRQVAEALQYAHDQHVIHRDIKPDNMLLDQYGKVMLSDFGMALIAQSSRQHNPQEIAGTAVYMAPEQFQGKTRRLSDQYELAVVVYEWLCGERPFRGSFAELASQHLFMLPPSLRALQPQLPAEVEQVIFKALAKDPLQRFMDIQTFASALEEASRQAQRPPDPPQFLSPEQRAWTAPQKAIGPKPLAGRSKAEQARPMDMHNIPPAQAIGQPFAQNKPLLPPPPEKFVRPGATKREEQTTSEIPSQKQLPAKTTDAIAAQGRPALSPPPAQSPRPTPATPAASATPQRLEQILPPEKTPFLSRRALIVGSCVTGLLIATGIAWEIVASHSRPPQGTTLYIYLEHSAAVNAVAWSPDGKRIASASADQTVRIWDALTGANPIPPKGHSGPVECVVWSPDGARIASAALDHSGVRVWSPDQTIDSPYPYPDADIYAVAWSSNSSYLAAGTQDHKVKIWNTSNSTEFSLFINHHTDAVRAVAWLPGGMRIASGSDDKTVLIWDARGDGNPVPCNGHSGPITGVSWSPDGKLLASSSEDTTVRLWNASDGSSGLQYRARHNDKVTGVAWSPDGKWIASCSLDQTVQVWDPTTGTTLFTYKDHKAPVNALAWSPDSTRIASADSANKVRVWQALSL